MFASCHGAGGIDGESIAAFGEGLEERLARLHEELRTDSYAPQPVRQVRITPCRVTMIVKTGLSGCAPTCAKARWMCDTRTSAKVIRIVRPAQPGRLRRKKTFALMIGPSDGGDGELTSPSPAVFTCLRPSATTSAGWFSSSGWRPRPLELRSRAESVWRRAKDCAMGAGRLRRQDCQLPANYARLELLGAPLSPAHRDKSN